MGTFGKLVTRAFCLSGYFGQLCRITCGLGMLENKDLGSQKPLCVLLKGEAAYRWRGQAGLVAVAGNAFGGWEPGYMREVLPAVGPGPFCHPRGG